MRTFYELEKLELLISQNTEMVRAEVLAHIPTGIDDLPLWALEIGSDKPDAPVYALIGGIHGLEKVGSQAVLAFLYGFINRIKWDKVYRDLLDHVRIVSIPIVNPAGMLLHKRSNLNGIDIMRNTPQDAKENTRFLISGHRISRRLPWYRGAKNAEMETETRAVIDFLSPFLSQSPFVLSLDVHSGFGVHDRIWYPYGCSAENFPDYKQFEHMYRTFSESFPYHIYRTESQTDSYGIHGDLWDFITLQNAPKQPHSTAFIPLTLEMGSWRWVKKNPRQLFGKQGIFNPIKRHRYERTMRRHYPLFDFLLHACVNYQYWDQSS